RPLPGFTKIEHRPGQHHLRLDERPKVFLLLRMVEQEGRQVWTILGFSLTYFDTTARFPPRNIIRIVLSQVFSIPLIQRPALRLRFAQPASTLLVLGKERF